MARTAKQRMYDYKEKLHDEAWRLERMIARIEAQGKCTHKLCMRYADVIRNISIAEMQLKYAA